MKILAAMVLALGSCSVFGQHEINWKPCTEAQKKLDAEIAAFNKGRTDGLVLSVNCMYQGTEQERTQNPKRHVPLTAKEQTVLTELRRNFDDAYEAKSAYEKHLLRAHGLPLQDYGDRCYRYIGFVLDDLFITDDPNPMMPYMCDVKIIAKQEELVH